MGGTSGPSFQKVNKERDILGEETVTGTANVFKDFLNQGVNQADISPIINAALQGETATATLPLVNSLRQENLLNQDNAIKQLNNTVAGFGRNQFGQNQLVANILSQFGIDRSKIPARIFTDVINTLIPQQLQQNAQTSGNNQAALAGSQNFNPVSPGRQAQAINRTVAGQPPEQGKSGAGIGALLGTAASLLIPGGQAAAPVLVGLGNAAEGLSFGGRNASGNFFS